MNRRALTPCLSQRCLRAARLLHPLSVSPFSGPKSFLLKLNPNPAPRR